MCSLLGSERLPLTQGSEVQLRYRGPRCHHSHATVPRLPGTCTRDQGFVKEHGSCPPSQKIRVAGAG